MADYIPLQVIALADSNCDVASSYLQEIEKAFFKDTGALPTDLHWVTLPYRRIQLQEDAAELDIAAMTKWLDRADKTLLLLLVTRQMQDSTAAQERLKSLLSLAAAAHATALVFELEEKADRKAQAKRWLRKFTSIPDTTFYDIPDVGEYAFRKVAVGLIAMSVAARELAQFSDSIEPSVKLFISHAKKDGQPLASALRSFIKALPQVSCFYDDDEITLEDARDQSRLKDMLEKGAANSVMIVLRSERFHESDWCRMELAMADEFQAPYVVVELRHAKSVPASTLDFDRGPTVWVADGNLYRVLFNALQLAIMSRLHLVKAERYRDDQGYDTKAFCILIRPPSLRGLANLRDRLPGDRKAYIVYPDPRLSPEDESAMGALLSTRARKVTVTTLQTLRLTGA